MQKRGTATMLSGRWRWMTAMAVPCTRNVARRDSNNWFDIDEMLKAKLATIFEDPVAEDEEEIVHCSSSSLVDYNNKREKEENKMVKTTTTTTTTLVARKGGGWKKVKELQSRFKKTRMQVGLKGSYVYFLAAFVSKAGFHSPAYLSNNKTR